MELAIYRSISFIYPLFASLKCLVCQPPTPRLTSTARHHSPAIIHPKSPHRTQSSHTRSSHHETPKLLESYQQNREGIILLKKALKMREENPTLPKSCKQGVQIKDQIPFPSMSPSPSISLTSHKIRIWLSSNPSWITVWLGNIGNQGMQHSAYP